MNPDRKSHRHGRLRRWFSWPLLAFVVVAGTAAATAQEEEPAAGNGASVAVESGAAASAPASSSAPAPGTCRERGGWMQMSAEQVEQLTSALERSARSRAAASASSATPDKEVGAQWRDPVRPRRQYTILGWITDLVLDEDEDEDGFYESFSFTLQVEADVETIGDALFNEPQPPTEEVRYFINIPAVNEWLWTVPTYTIVGLEKEAHKLPAVDEGVIEYFGPPPRADLVLNMSYGAITVGSTTSGTMTVLVENTRPEGDGIKVDFHKSYTGTALSAESEAEDDNESWLRRCGFGAFEDLAPREDPPDDGEYDD